MKRNIYVSRLLYQFWVKDKGILPLRGVLEPIAYYVNLQKLMFSVLFILLVICFCE